MKLRFDANQEFQVRAVEAVADLFDGQTEVRPAMKFELTGEASIAAVENRLDLSDEDILANLHAIQKRNGISLDAGLEFIEEPVEGADGAETIKFMNFSVEMETGTGKTYVHIRTIHELRKRYGMRKFIVVVPSVAIREGVLKTLRITEDHFRALFDNQVYRYYVYDSSNLSQVRQFAQSDAVEIMVMTIDSFNKAANVIRQVTDKLPGGATPLQLVQAARPILILDEPQNMESEKSIAALATLKPLFALRYSATHRNPYNIVNRLMPAEAYRQGLVKKIEVDSVVTEKDENRPYVRLVDIQAKKRTLTARLAVHKLMRSGQVKEKTVTVRPGDSLAEKANREDYKGFEIDEINAGQGFVRFANEVEIKPGGELGADKETLFAAQIRHTVEEHFRKQKRLKDHGIKVLSLFFIDRVDNYAREDGIIRKLFYQAFDELKASHPDFATLSAQDVQAAYFAQKRRRGGEVELLDSSEGRDKKEDSEAYDLIMRDKEALLTFPSPDDDDEARRKKQVCFIFSHSALREGWDNPNVFQICTLNQTASIVKKRQEVGRGVRLAVDRNGDRIHDERVNVLTVVANESYRQYVETLQDEIAFEYREEIEARYGKAVGDLSDEERRKIEEEYGEGILPPPPRQAGQRKARLRKARALREDFKELWERIKHKTRYAVRIDTPKLLAQVVPEIEKADVAPPRVTITKAAVRVGDDSVFEAIQTSRARTAVDLAGRYPLPNLVELMSNLMEHTSPPVRLTRRTLLDLFRQVRDKKAATDNPHEWAAVAVRILKEKLADHLVDGIQYEKTGEWYEMSQILSEEEVELFCKYIAAPDESKDQTLYDLIPCDSEIERQFVKELEARQDVKLYVKLPRWFKVLTPVGEYNPDWAIVMQEDNDGTPVLYLVTETKGSDSLDDLRPDERRKVLCGAAHFGSKQLKTRGALDGVNFKVVNTAGHLP